VEKLESKGQWDQEDLQEPWECRDRLVQLDQGEKSDHQELAGDQVHRVHAVRLVLQVQLVSAVSQDPKDPLVHAVMTAETELMEPLAQLDQQACPVP